MIAKKQLIFWVGVWLFLILLFSTSVSGLVISIYFVTILLPVVIATSIFFNRFLVPNYLLKSQKSKFLLYLFYMLVVSIYLELLVMVLAFVVLADYQIENLGKIAGDIYLLTLILYLVVFAEGLILSIQKLRDNTLRLAEIEQALENEQKEEVIIRSDRRNVNIKLNDILFIESFGDYVKIHRSEKFDSTREKISSFESRLPQYFIRVHRSYLVNRDHIDSYNKEIIRLGDYEIPIGRKYRKKVEDVLQVNVTS